MKVFRVYIDINVPDNAETDEHSFEELACECAENALEERSIDDIFEVVELPSEEKQIAIGITIAEVLNVKCHKAYAEDNEHLRYHTAWGDKTALGLYATIERIMKREGNV